MKFWVPDLVWGLSRTQATMLGCEPRSLDIASDIPHWIIVVRPWLVAPVAEYIRLYTLQPECLYNLEDEKLYFRESFHSYKQLSFSSTLSSSVKSFQALWAVESPFSVPQGNISKSRVITFLSAVCNLTERFLFGLGALWKQRQSLYHVWIRIFSHSR